MGLRAEHRHPCLGLEDQAQLCDSGFRCPANQHAPGAQIVEDREVAHIRLSAFGPSKLELFPAIA